MEIEGISMKKVKRKKTTSKAICSKCEGTGWLTKKVQWKVGPDYDFSIICSTCAGYGKIG